MNILFAGKLNKYTGKPLRVTTKEPDKDKRLDDFQGRKCEDCGHIIEETPNTVMGRKCPKCIQFAKTLREFDATRRKPYGDTVYGDETQYGGGH